MSTALQDALEVRVIDPILFLTDYDDTSASIGPPRSRRDRRPNISWTLTLSKFIPFYHYRRQHRRNVQIVSFPLVIVCQLTLGQILLPILLLPPWFYTVDPWLIDCALKKYLSVPHDLQLFKGVYLVGLSIWRAYKEDAFAAMQLMFLAALLPPRTYEMMARFPPWERPLANMALLFGGAIIQYIVFRLDLKSEANYAVIALAILHLLGISDNWVKMECQWLRMRSKIQENRDRGRQVRRDRSRQGRKRAQREHERRLQAARKSKNPVTLAHGSSHGGPSALHREVEDFDAYGGVWDCRGENDPLDFLRDYESDTGRNEAKGVHRGRSQLRYQPSSMSFSDKSVFTLSILLHTTQKFISKTWKAYLLVQALVLAVYSVARSLCWFYGLEAHMVHELAPFRWIDAPHGYTLPLVPLSRFAYDLVCGIASVVIEDSKSCSAMLMSVPERLKRWMSCT
ncbi:hypothetical protein BU24DRAFT_496596 [Aaosphaeria arxii CBS 175.79]|uniref:Uncharacterized protein n=1 Tax=Aaosphaeria arxii CBS 175.79 TaxID=1450172 RepID=A0A6A5XCM9_9PLEO|nr:uncharacterized protein BU24DRAFT_496596 [Aaosphaeria arxii CBS 175.79]KAF2010651.1 hypothetical protein BU24DRAFT_496596 [Aaosphaeria arxii CBS 175.79]